jgi:hypothetical protein
LAGRRWDRPYLFGVIQVVANLIMPLAWRYARLQGRRSRRLRCTFSMVNPAQHKPDLLILAGYRRDRKDLTQ